MANKTNQRSKAKATTKVKAKSPAKAKAPTKAKSALSAGRGKASPQSGPVRESRRYPGFLVSQRSSEAAVRLVAFYAAVRDILQWAGIRRVGVAKDGAQRMLRPVRATAVKNYLVADERNTIPNNILVAFGKGSADFISQQLPAPQGQPTAAKPESVEFGYLHFDFDPDVLESKRTIQIVDGQHRIFGASEFEGEDIPLLVVGLLDADAHERAFQFIVINNKATRVPTDNVKAIIEGLDEEKLRRRLLDSGVRYGGDSPVLLAADRSPDSPFRGLLDWPLNRRDDQKIVALTTIEQSLRYLHAALKAGDDEDEDAEQQILFAMWRAVKAYYPTLWAKGSEASDRFMSKVNMLALHEILCNRLVYGWEMDLFDIYSAKDVQERTTEQLDRIPREFWESPWAFKVQDTTAIRSLIKNDIETLQLNSKKGRAWHTDIKCAVPTQSGDVTAEGD